MVKIMENHIFKWMIWGGKPTIFGNIHIENNHETNWKKKNTWKHICSSKEK